MSKYTIKEIYIKHWESYLDSFPNVRPVVIKEVSKMMNCQNPDLGHALYQCEHCGKFKCVPFTCKSRFCNCCGIKYQQDRANTLSAKLINCNHRHIVFTSSAQVLLDWFYSCNKSENFKPGIISGLHTFGRDLKWNPHIHMLVTEGGSGNFTVWRKFAHFPYLMLRKKWQTTLLFNMEKYLGKHNFRVMKNLLYKNNPDGFYVYAKPNLSSTYDVVNYIIRYIARPAMAQSRIISVDDEFITFWYQRHEDNQRAYETITIFQFFQRLIIHIPDEQFKMLRYYGIYAKKYIHHSKLIKRISQVVINSRKLLSRWRERIELSFGYDPTKCSCRQLHVFY